MCLSTLYDIKKEKTTVLNRTLLSLSLVWFTTKFSLLVFNNKQASYLKFLAQNNNLMMQQHKDLLSLKYYKVPYYKAFLNL